MSNVTILNPSGVSYTVIYSSGVEKIYPLSQTVCELNSDNTALYLLYNNKIVSGCSVSTNNRFFGDIIFGSDTPSVAITTVKTVIGIADNDSGGGGNVTNITTSTPITTSIINDVIISAATSQIILPASASRKYVEIANYSDKSLWIQFGQPAGVDDGFVILPFQPNWYTPANVSPVLSVNIFGEESGQKFAIMKA